MFYRSLLTWVVLIALNVGAGIVLIPAELQRGIATGSLTVTSDLLSLTPVQWALALGLVVAVLVVRWLFLTGTLMFFGALVSANDSFRKTAPVVALSLIPLAAEEGLRAVLVGSGWFPTTSSITLDVSVLWPSAPLFLQSILGLTDPFQLWGLWILARGLVTTGVYQRAKYAWCVSTLVIAVSLALGRILLPA